MQSGNGVTDEELLRLRSAALDRVVRQKLKLEQEVSELKEELEKCRRSH